MSASGVFRLTGFQRVAAHVALILLSIPAVLPLVWMVSSSLKTDRQIFAPQAEGAPPITVASLIPHPVHWRNYPDALSSVPFLLYVKNTVWLAAINVLGAVLSSAIVAYGFAR